MPIKAEPYEHVPLTDYTPTTPPPPQGVPLPSSERRKTNADSAIRLLLYETDVLQTPDGEVFCGLPNGDGASRHYHRLDSQAVRNWLTVRMWTLFGVVLRRTDVDDALTVVHGHAAAYAPVESVHTRMTSAPTPEGFTMDSGQDNRVIVVTGDGWAVTERAADGPRFVRYPGMLPLPEPAHPQPGETLAELAQYLNVGSLDTQEGRDRFRLIVGWLLGTLMPTGPYPVLEITGQRGSAKTTGLRMLRNLVDPNVSVFNALGSEEDLRLQANQSWVLSFDNLSHITTAQSDLLCRIATGYSGSKRRLYTDSDTVQVNVSRPILLNGISDLARRDDLLERTLRIKLPPLAANQRKTERELLAAYEAARPRLLGILLDAAVYALAHPVTESNLPRLADWYLWVRAAEGSGLLGWVPQPGDDFAAAMARNTTRAHTDAVESDLAAANLLHYLQNLPSHKWEGTMDELLSQLREEARRASDLHSPYTNWPATPSALALRLDRLASDLEAMGVTVERTRGNHGVRTVHLAYTPPPPETEAAAAAA
jgi:hypothetical protein